MRILLAYVTDCPDPSLTNSETDFTSLLPIGLCSLHALLRSRGFEVTLANLTGTSEQDYAALLQQTLPDLLGFSHWTHNRHSTYHYARFAKKVLPACRIILGGGHATHQAELILQRHPEIDLIVAGEAEQTLPELLQALQAKSAALQSIPGLVLRSTGEPLRTPARLPLQFLDTLQFPAAHLRDALNVDLSLQPEFISTSRGCPAACNFCASPAFWGQRVRYRSAASVAAEMRFVRDEYGLIYLSLRDDTFTADRRRTVELCREMIESRLNVFWNCQSRVEAIDRPTLEWMRKAGCECIQLGVESGSERMLHLLGKRIKPSQVVKAAELIHQAGIQLSVYLISGIPGETDTDRRQTIDLINAIMPDDVQAAPLAYYPGTTLFKQAVKDGTVPDDLFETNHHDAVLAQRDGQRQVDRLLSRTAGFRYLQSVRQLQGIQREQGFSAVTAMHQGDLQQSLGNRAAAEAQYRQLTTHEPDHPWGWYLLAELLEQQGRTRDAAGCYERVLQLVPRHLPSQQGLQRTNAKKATEFSSAAFQTSAPD